jgi:hypothetical protein
VFSSFAASLLGVAYIRQREDYDAMVSFLDWVWCLGVVLI